MWWTISFASRLRQKLSKKSSHMHEGDPMQVESKDGQSDRQSVALLLDKSHGLNPFSQIGKWRWQRVAKCHPLRECNHLLTDINEISFRVRGHKQSRRWPKWDDRGQKQCNVPFGLLFKRIWSRVRTDILPTDAKQFQSSSASHTWKVWVKGVDAYLFWIFSQYHDSTRELVEHEIVGACAEDSVVKLAALAAFSLWDKMRLNSSALSVAYIIFTPRTDWDWTSPDFHSGYWHFPVINRPFW